MSANYTGGPTPGNTTTYNTTSHGTIIDGAVGALYKTARDDNKLAALILLGIFLILTQLLCIIRDCKRNSRKGYTRGTINGEEGLELVIRAETAVV